MLWPATKQGFLFGKGKKMFLIQRKLGILADEPTLGQGELEMMGVIQVEVFHRSQENGNAAVDWGNLHL